MALLVGVSLFIWKGGSTGTQAANSLQSQTEAGNPLDTLSGADIAVHLAAMAHLDETTAVVNTADTASAQLSVVSNDSQVVAKPQIVNTTIKSKTDIKSYVVVAGDTVSAIATKFGVTSDSVKWSNGLTSDRVAAGKTLLIPPINGIVHTVKPGDTPESLARTFNATKEHIITFNDAEISGLKVGENIVIPNGRKAAPTYTAGFSFGAAAVYGFNGYDYGWCTWHAANRRQQTGRPIPANLGNAISWLSRARSAGLTVGSAPQPGAVIYHKNLGGLGHVAFVESVNKDGSAHVTDMNYPGWGRVTSRTIKPSEFGNYAFIY